VALGLLGAAPLLERSLRAEARRRASDELGAIAALKSQWITTWRLERLRFARFAARYPSVLSLAEAVRRGVVPSGLTNHTSEVLGQIALLQGYQRIAVLEGTRELAGWARAGGRAAVPTQELVGRALGSADGTASELLLDPTDRPYLDVVVAIPAGSDRSLLLFLRADAVPVFEEVLDHWPVPSESGAGSVGLREGDTIRLVVADRMTAAGIPRVERIPAADLRRPVARAFMGDRGLIEGVDFTGIPILVASREIPGTAWRVQARIAAAEIEEPLRRPIAAIRVLGAALLGAAALLLALAWRQQRARAALDARLAEAQERLALAVSGTHSVLDWDLAAGAVHFDPPWAVGGGPPVSVLSGSFDELVARLVHPDDVPEVRARLEALFRGEVPVHDFEHRIPGAGPIRSIRVRGRVSLRTPGGRPLRFTAVVSDVTERRAMQSQLDLSQRMAALGALAAGVAHEINNPLSSVCANLDFLARETGKEPALAEVVAETRDGAERVRDVVRGLRSFSSARTGAPGPADVRAELEAAIRLARNEIRHRARLELRIEDLPLVAAGAHELGQVFLNILLNAAQAIPEGRAQENVITVEAGRAADGGASIRIRDTGVGIPPHVLDRIFEPFYTTKPLGVGMGLGLAIAHRIVTGAGGRIEVETQVGRGTAFHVVLPAAGAEEERAPTPAAAPRPAAPEAAASRRRVLVVDDDALVVRSVARTLADRYEVVTCASALEVRARVERGERFDALLCDLMMPDMTGMELHGWLAARAPELARRVLFITGGAFTEAAVRFLAEGGAPCVEKPFEPEELRQAVERVAAA
jgi:C4-dicarboxylate-specific signal transduction histidine kinase/ActR/RegA family two-component response regulator